MDRDDRIRSRSGLVVCLRDMGDGTSRLFFDDASADCEENTGSWKHECFLTFTPPIDNTELDALTLSDERLAEIGFIIVARLAASNGRLK